MNYLLIASLIWSFSFGLIKHYLAGVDANAVAFVRLSLSLLIFLPFWRPRGISISQSIKLILIGSIQYGVMYASYIQAYHYLKAYEVAMLTIFTPIFVTLIHDALQHHFRIRHLVATLLAVVGGGVIFWRNGITSTSWHGILLMQLANLSFAFGQVAYKSLNTNATTKFMADTKSMAENKYTWLRDARQFPYMYLGAVVTTGVISLFSTDWSTFSLTGKQIAVLTYLGIFPSGIAFFLWNAGARKVSGVILAVFNNLKIPLAVTVALLVFGEHANPYQLLAGGFIIMLALVFAAIRKE